jgi:hypothetical protein
MGACTGSSSLPPRRPCPSCDSQESQRLWDSHPRCVRRFAESLGQRSKTDPVDASVLCQYAARMPLALWQPPSLAALRLRAITCTIAESSGFDMWSFSGVCSEEADVNRRMRAHKVCGTNVKRLLTHRESLHSCKMSQKTPVVGLV